MFKWMFKQPNQNHKIATTATTPGLNQKPKGRSNEPGAADLAALELLQTVETYPVLVLMLPRLVKELKKRLIEIEQEQAAISIRLQHLYTRRNDILAASINTGNDGENGSAQISRGATASIISPATAADQVPDQKQVEGEAA